MSNASSTGNVSANIARSKLFATVQVGTPPLLSKWKSLKAKGLKYDLLKSHSMAYINCQITHESVGCSDYKN